MSVEREVAIKNHMTPNGKQLGLYRVANTSLYGIRFEGGGEIPDSLSGRFTNTDLAFEAIAGYLNQRWEEYGKVEAKAENDRQLRKERAQRKPGGDVDGAASAG